MSKPLQPVSSSECASLWTLDPSVTFLNHGSYGACPSVVLEKQREIRAQLEREPLRFYGREWEPLLHAVRDMFAPFVGAGGDEVVFIPNATTGVNTILHALRFHPNDELLITNHEYNACRNAIEAVAQRHELKVVVAELPFPVRSYDEIVTPIKEAITERTRLFLIDHVGSMSSLIMPVRELVQEMRARNIYTLIDGAHAPGMIDINLRDLGADFYTGNCHKWLCAPKGAAFLYVRRDLQGLIRPLVISHGANSPRTDKSRFLLEFDWMGTHDPSPYLSIPTAIEFLHAHGGGAIGEVQKRNHELMLQGRKIICEALEVAPPCPESMVGSMGTIELPDVFSTFNFQALHDLLLDSYNIELQVMPSFHSDRPMIRISAHLYNSREQYSYLAECLKEIAAQR